MPAIDGGLSVVIPAYNEERRLGATLEAVARYLAARGLDGEIVVVDDGSADRTAAVAESAAAATALPLRLLRHPVNLGKGASVRTGCAAAAKAVVLFSDADLSTPIEESARLLDALDSGADVAIGSRALDGSRIEVRQAWYRELMGKTYNLLVRALTGLEFRDTQCGFKAFRRAALSTLLPELKVHRFGFDVELLYLARRHGYQVVEVPVLWRNSPQSRVNPLTDSARMLWDLLLLRLRTAGQRR